jgi:two-component system, NtrC family, response regulator HydG
MAEMLAEGLADRGYEVIAVASSEEAIVHLRDEPFDALVTDLRMPGVDGLALLAEARRASPDLPVIVMTAYGAVDSAIESMRRGANHYLTKPFKTEELALFLDRAIDERSARRDASAMHAAPRDRPPESGLVAERGAMQHGFAPPVMPVRDLQRRYAAWALEQLGGHRTRTAERLGIDLKTLAKWLSEGDAPGERPSG